MSFSVGFNENIHLFYCVPFYSLTDQICISGLARFILHYYLWSWWSSYSLSSMSKWYVLFIRFIYCKQTCENFILPLTSASWQNLVHVVWHTFKRTRWSLQRNIRNKVFICRFCKVFSHAKLNLFSVSQVIIH